MTHKYETWRLEGDVIVPNVKPVTQMNNCPFCGSQKIRLTGTIQDGYYNCDNDGCKMEWSAPVNPEKLLKVKYPVIGDKSKVRGRELREGVDFMFREQCSRNWECDCEPCAICRYPKTVAVIIDNQQKVEPFNFEKLDKDIKEKFPMEQKVSVPNADKEEGEKELWNEVGKIFSGVNEPYKCYPEELEKLKQFKIQKLHP